MFLRSPRNAETEPWGWNICQVDRGELEHLERETGFVSHCKGKLRLPLLFLFLDHTCTWVLSALGIFRLPVCSFPFFISYLSDFYTSLLKLTLQYLKWKWLLNASWYKPALRKTLRRFDKLVSLNKIIRNWVYIMQSSSLTYIRTF